MIASVSVVFASVMILVGGEMRFVCPRPQSPSSTAMGRKPCGGSGDPVNLDTDYTVVKPGPFTVHLEETVFRSDSPGRISLLDLGSVNRSCLLLDHIPHNNLGMSYHTNDPDINVINQNQSECSVSDYPLGRCSSSSYITVNIPDIECKRCVLQFMTTDISPSSSFHHCFLDYNCTGNYTCANIKIIPTSAGKGRGIEACQQYIANLRGFWPYTQTKYFKASLGGSPFVGGFARFSKAQFDVLRYNISLGDVAVIPERDQLYIVLRLSKERLYNIHVTANSIVGQVESFDNIPTDLLLNMSLAIEIRVTSTGRVLYRDIVYNPDFGIQNFVRFSPFERYERHSAEYSPSGWLTGPDFVGIRASYTQGVQPAGICSPEIKQYAAILMDTSGSLRGLVTYGVVSGERLHLDGLVVTPRGSASFINLSTKGQDATLTFPGNDITRGHAKGTLSLSDNTDPNFVTTRIRIDNRYENISSTSFKAIKAVVTDKEDGFTALGVIQLLGKNDLKITVVILNKTADRMVRAEVFIKGEQLGKEVPGRVSIAVPQTGDPDVGGWVGELVLQVEDSLISHYLRLGQLSLVVVPINRMSLSAEFSSVSDWICADNKHIACEICKVYTGGIKVDRGSKEILPNGLATFYSPHNNVGLIEYTLTVRDLRPKELVRDVFLTRGHLVLPPTSGKGLPVSVRMDKSWTSRGLFNLSGLNKEATSDTDIKLVVTTNLLRENDIYGSISHDIPGIAKASVSTATSRGDNLKTSVSTAVGLAVLSIAVLFSMS